MQCEKFTVKYVYITVKGFLVYDDNYLTTKRRGLFICTARMTKAKNEFCATSQDKEYDEWRRI